MSESLVGIYGASGFGREVLPLVRFQFNGESVKVVFVDDGESPETLSDYPVWTYQNFLDWPADDKKIVLAIANGEIRAKLAGKCAKDGIEPLSVAAESTVLLDDVTLGEGSILCHFTHLTSNVRIGKFFHANIYSYVAHDCLIGDYVTFAPAVRCNGNVIIGDHAYIGTGATIKQGTPSKPLVIGEGAIVGMGAVVTKDVPPGITVIGNPAKPF